MSTHLQCENGIDKQTRHQRSVLHAHHSARKRLKADLDKNTLLLEIGASIRMQQVIKINGCVGGISCANKRFKNHGKRMGRAVGDG